MLKELKIATTRRSEFIDITSRVQEMLTGLKAGSGVVLLYVPHTTAGITINESADSAVVADILSCLERLVPWRADYLHREGNSAAHIKGSLMGQTLQVLVEKGELLLGTWQGIFFCEFDGPRSRKLFLKFIPG